MTASMVTSSMSASSSLSACSISLPPFDLCSRSQTQPLPLSVVREPYQKNWAGLWLYAYAVHDYAYAASLWKTFPIQSEAVGPVQGQCCSLLVSQVGPFPFCSADRFQYPTHGSALGKRPNGSCLLLPGNTKQ